MGLHSSSTAGGPAPALIANLDQLEAVPSGWRAESDRLTGLTWSALAEATGEGDALAAARGCADPAGQAVRSIGVRLGTMAGLLERFATDVQRQDASIAADFERLRAR